MQDRTKFTSLPIYQVRTFCKKQPFLATRKLHRVNFIHSELEPTQFIEQLSKTSLDIIEHIGTSSHQDKLCLAWDALNNCNVYSAHTLSNLLIVLIETACSTYKNDITFHPLQRTKPIKTPKATAANPRAYKGTRYKPPKPISTHKFDLRKFVFNESTIQHTLNSLSFYFEDACSLLIKQGYPSNRLHSLYDTTLGWRDVFLAYHYPNSPKNLTCSQLPQHFVCDLLPCLQGTSWNVVLIHLRAYWALNLEQEKALRAAVVAILLTASPNTRIDIFEFWYRVLAQTPVNLRTLLATLIFESLAHCGVFSASTFQKIESTFQSFHELYSELPSEDYAHRAYALLEPLHRNIDSSYRLNGLLLVDANSKDTCLIDMGDEDSLSYEETIQYSSKLPTSPFTLWKRCSQWPGLANIIRTTHWNLFEKKS